MNSGESYDDCARREMEEELGLVLAKKLLRRHFQIAACSETGWEFVWVYSVRGDYHPIINPVEIESGSYWPVAEVARQLMDSPEKWAPSFRRVFDEFWQRRLFVL